MNVVKHILLVLVCRRLLLVFLMIQFWQFIEEHMGVGSLSHYSQWRIIHYHVHSSATSR